MSTTDKTADELFGTLTGFDELAIAKHFHTPVQSLIPDPDDRRGGPSPWVYFRALVFIDLRRGGTKDADAYKQAMELSVRDAQEYFADPTPDMDAEDPDTDLGKGSAPSE